MDRGLMTRVGLCVASGLLAVWLLLPTFLGKDVQDTLELAAKRDAMGDDAPPLAEPMPWWVSWLPNKKINLGLDLQGGIDLTLEVDTDEAVLSTVQRDIAPVKAMAEKDGVKLADVRRDRHSASLLIAPGEGVDLNAVQSFLRKRFSAYAYDHTETVNETSYLVFKMTDDAKAAVAKAAVDQALETIRNRIDETGVKEPGITRKGERGIDVQLPGESDVKQAVDAVGQVARLEFNLVDEDAEMNKVQQGLDAAKAAVPPDDYGDDRALSEWLSDNHYLPEGRKLLWEYAKSEGKDSRVRPYVLKDEVVLSGDDVNDAQTSSNPQTGSYYVSLEFKPHGQAVFAEVTGANVNKRFAIVLDNKVKSAPVIREKINGTASIEMGGANIDEQMKDAGTLALVLRSGSLPAPVTVGEVRTVGASLGDRAIKEGVYGAILGSALVLLLAGIYYRVSGFLADLSLILNAMLVLALLALAGATLTLPGICGIALTIGMAVDANIIIYERIREELRGGKTARGAIEAGFDRASVAVLDSNLSAMLAGVVLYSYGTGPIRGFAVTLMFGIITTLFTGVFVTRTLMELAFSGRRNTVSI
jgi:preprotein translocase subunit SecD